ncbi:MAG: hypothetical protein JXB39_03690 [Deltaproteobacteria bacterium]|nr:hypothetical protein [Deltaproteobacteria bacterium]
MRSGTPQAGPERHDVRPGTPPTGPERHDVRPGTPQAGPERHDARQVGPAGSSAFRPGTPRAGPDRPMGLGDGPVRARRESAGNRIPDARSSRASSPRRPDARYVDRARRVHVHRHTLSSHHRYGVHRTWAWRSRWWWWGPSYVWWHYPVYPWWRPAWTWGVFYDYPSTYAYYPYQGYVDTGDVPSEPQAEAHRQVERAHTFALGVRGGSYLGDYHGSGGFGDFGLGIAARYRAAEALGFELAWQIHDNTWSQDSERITKPFSASVELFAFPWRKVNPYALAGLTWTRRNYEDVLHDVWGEESGDVTRQDTLFGPHFGVGLELGVGSRASLNVEGRAVGYLNVDAEDPTVPSALQGTLGMNLYF